MNSLFIDWHNDIVIAKNVNFGGPLSHGLEVDAAIVLASTCKSFIEESIEDIHPLGQIRVRRL